MKRLTRYRGLAALLAHTVYLTSGMILRAVYSCLFYLATPFILLRLWWRGIKAPAYRLRWLERLGFYPTGQPDHVIWFHAVSVGEVEALSSLIKLLQQRHPDKPLLVTTTTPTGSARVSARWQGRVAHVYLPYDLPDVVERFLHCFKPKLAVIVETEIWPNLYAGCAAHAIPVVIVNARLSEKSVRAYQKISGLMRSTLAKVKLIATQSDEDRQRFLAIGASSEQTQTVGNVKFDSHLPDEIIQQGRTLKTQVLGSRLVLIAASTHHDEEKILAEIYLAIKPKHPELLLVLAPRHPERFADVHKLCEQLHLSVVTRNSQLACSPETDIFLLNTLGELKLFYAAADLAFIGGSLVPIGGHNVLEAAAAGVPALFGPYMGNFKLIADGMVNAAAAVQCADAHALTNALLTLVENPDQRRQLSEKSRLFVKCHQGVANKLCDLLEPYLSAVSTDAAS